MVGLADRFVWNACLFHCVTLCPNYSIFQHFCLKIYGLHSCLDKIPDLKDCAICTEGFFFLLDM